MKTGKTIETRWEVRTYDVWGNAKDGYEVNDSYRKPDVDLTLEVNKHNVGTPSEFEYATPTDAQIREVFGLKKNVSIETDGDDTHIYINAGKDSYPVGELYCLSHESLSPIRVKS